MIVSFRGRGTEDVFDGNDTKAARKVLPSKLHERGGKVLDQLHAAVSLKSLSLPGLRLEPRVRKQRPVSRDYSA